jgi:Protein of unknown function (DUF1153)
MRWTPKRKAAAVIAIERGTISTAEALQRHELSEEELAARMRDYAAHGRAGLCATRGPVWRVEWFNEGGGCEVEIFAGRNARERARRYAEQRCGKFEQMRLAP